MEVLEFVESAVKLLTEEIKPLYESDEASNRGLRKMMLSDLAGKLIEDSENVREMQTYHHGRNVRAQALTIAQMYQSDLEPDPRVIRMFESGLKQLGLAIRTNNRG